MYRCKILAYLNAENLLKLLNQKWNPKQQNISHNSQVFLIRHGHVSMFTFNFSTSLNREHRFSYINKRVDPWMYNVELKNT